MKTSYHTYNKEKGFYIKESYFELVSFFIVKSFINEELEDKPIWYLNIYEDFLDITNGHVQGYAYFNFEGDLEFIEEREQEIIVILEKAIDIITLEGDKIPYNKLNKWEEDKKDWPDTKIEWISDVYTEDLINVINILIKMLKHEWKENIDVDWKAR
ncbi:hypothetical protein GCM10011344_24950 [Dokdonia pacifica]|uniref:Uncharacterized protein n=1 Tax=Dokdonia pacifica TaxID=1627892 RepID=A0A238WQI3_9FLAO|nr:hypothetical protein [Dokdonia pacifica]GGG23219.1 hypothetical protein GCM10011344_24950 [Dokdonia pacifica]SNR48727.1 hypothetical protein SAMN06265376_1011325 [Dokdonia pacifica]